MENNFFGDDLIIVLFDLGVYVDLLGVSCNVNDIVLVIVYMSIEFNNWVLYGDGIYDFSDDMCLIFGLCYIDDEVFYIYWCVNNDEYGCMGVGVCFVILDIDVVGSVDEINLFGCVGI